MKPRLRAAGRLCALAVLALVACARPSAAANSEVFVIGDILPVGAVNDQFAHGFSQQVSAGVQAGANVPVLGQTLMFVWSYYDIGYRHAAGYVPSIDGGSTYVPALVNHQYTLEERSGVRIPSTPVNLGLAIFYHPNRVGLPVLVGGGIGAEVLPNPQKAGALYGRLYYYPNVTSEKALDGVASRYSYLRYEFGEGRRVGSIGKFGLLLTASIVGDHATAIAHAPTDVNLTSLQLGLGLGF